MDNTQKQMLKAELSGIKGMISASGASAAAVNQITYPVAGPVIIIPALSMAAQTFKQQADCMDKLANMIEKVINAS